jgi:hypothetical protein
MPGRLSRAMRARAAPLGVPAGNRTRVISSSMRFGCSRASMPDIESGKGNNVIARRTQGGRGRLRKFDDSCWHSANLACSMMDIL